MKRYTPLFVVFLGLLFSAVSLSAQLTEGLDYEIRTREESVAPAVPWPDMTVEMGDFLGQYFSFPVCWNDEGDLVRSDDDAIEIKVIAFTMSAAGTMARGPLRGEVEDGEVVSCIDQRLHASLKGMVQMGPDAMKLFRMVFADSDK